MIFTKVVVLLALAAPSNAIESTNLRANEDETLKNEIDFKLPRDTLKYRAKFNDWKAKFNKVYDNVEEEVERLIIWVENNEYIQKHNEKNLSYKLGHNHFSDLTNEEFRERNFLGEFFPGINKSRKSAVSKINKRFENHKQTAESRILQSVGELDWRQKGAVTPVKDQAMCGSCWSFSSTGAIEGASFLKYGELVSLSEQELIDCDMVDLGCNGGLMDQAFEFDETSGGLCSELDYPYLAEQEDMCMSSSCTPVPGSAVTSYTDVIPNDVQALMDAITLQPVSVAIQADQMEFQLYDSGVFDFDGCGTQIDHAVLAVGYGTEEGQDYFLIKNSWGETWGDDGYIKLARNSEQPEGTCGVLTLSSYPTVE